MTAEPGHTHIKECPLLLLHPQVIWDLWERGHALAFEHTQRTAKMTDYITVQPVVFRTLELSIISSLSQPKRTLNLKPLTIEI